MPLYEYRCADCGHELEVLQKISAPAPVECPACHKPGLQKQVTAAGFQLKGTGWYVTDFRGGNKGAAAAAKGGETAAGGADGAPAAATAPPAAAGAEGGEAAASSSGSSSGSPAATPAASPPSAG
jgi:putative FmdB family regulatory protein